jgi:hypothetical protein
MKEGTKGSITRGEKLNNESNVIQSFFLLDEKKEPR